MRRITGFVGSRESLIHISKIVSTAKKINSKNGSRARVFHLERDISKKGFLVSTNIFFLSLHVGGPTCYTHSLASDYHPTLPFPSGKVFWTKLKTRGFFSVAFFSFPAPPTLIITYDLHYCSLLFSRRNARAANRIRKFVTRVKQKKKEKKGEELLHRCNIGYITYFS